MTVVSSMLVSMSIMNVSGLVAIVLWSSLCMGQEVHVTRGKGSVVLSVSAQKPYQLLSGEGKMPMLSVECAHRAKRPDTLWNFRLAVPWLKKISKSTRNLDS